MKGGGGALPRSVRLTHTVLRKALSDALRVGSVARNIDDRATGTGGSCFAPTT